jgi:hypothetical protein
VTVLVAQSVLADVDRWWNATGHRAGLAKADLYDLVSVAAREVEASWSALTVEPDGSRLYTSRPDDPTLPSVTLQVFDVDHASRLVRPGDLVGFLVVWDIRFWYPRIDDPPIDEGDL